MKQTTKRIATLLLTLLLAVGCAAPVSAAAPEAPAPQATQKVRRISLNRKTLTLCQGSSFLLKAKVFPRTAPNKKIRWKSNDTDIATVTAAGRVKGMDIGRATITATSVSGRKIARCKVNVVAKGSQTPAPAPTPEPTPAPEPAPPAAPGGIPDSATVWVPRTGAKFHSTPTCSGMRNPSQTTAGDARSRGYTPCSKCW